MSYRISVDTGGTFTDVVVVDDQGKLHIGKAGTQRGAPFPAIRAGLTQVADEFGTSVDDLLAASDTFTYGTTRATNTIVEGTTAVTALFATEGFPDVLLLREGGKLDPWGQIPYQAPYIPRELTFEIVERIDSEGSVFVELDEDSVIAAIEQARAAGCESIAVALIWSISNPAHELRIGELLEERWPGVPYTLSHQLNPIVREYRRASSTAIDASLKPLMHDHLSTLEEDLRSAGFRGHVFVATSYGASWRPSDVMSKPVYSIGSGPSMAPVAALRYAREELGREGSTPDVLVCDTGGTTFDVGLVRGGEVNYTAETWIGGRYTGHITGIRSVNVKSIGAGGGSIVWIDPGGLLRVGPRSAGANPGPACYGRGGMDPTLTDAALLLGYIDPAYFLGGRLALDPDAAHGALAPVCERLGMSTREAAAAALVLATENVVGAIRELTIAQGIDPRELTIVAGGGASGLNIVPIARELGCRQVLLPSTAAALSACGALFSDVIREFPKSGYADTGLFDFAGVDETLHDIEAQASAFLDDLTDLRPLETTMQFFVEARYRGQVWELDVPLRGNRVDDADDVRTLEEDFHATHERVFAVREPGQHLECLLWKGRATAVLDKAPLRPRQLTGGEPRVHDYTTAYFAATGAVEIPRFDGDSLPSGARIEGPAIIREPATTVVVYPDAYATITPLGNYLLEVGGADARERASATEQQKGVPT